MKINLPTYLLFGLLLAVMAMACNRQTYDQRPIIEKQLKANPDQIRVFSNRTTVINPLLNDSIGEGDFTVIFGRAWHGEIVTHKTVAGFNYTPQANYIGPDSIIYTVMQNNKVSTNWVVLEVTDSVNCEVQLMPDSIILEQNTAGIVISPLANDVVCGIYTVLNATLPGYGAIMQEGNSFKYTASPNFIGTDQFTYSVCKGKTCYQQVVKIKVGQACNLKFRANADSVSLQQYMSVYISPGQLLLNDSVCAGDIAKVEVNALAVTKGNIFTQPGYSSKFYGAPDYACTDTLEYIITSKSVPLKTSKARIIIKVL